ncbi:MAG: hypothetical protein QXG00_00190 [Candidatus Woesearchaeota archaeon]
MEKQQIKQTVKVPTVQEVMGRNLPEKKFQAGAISVTIWENETEREGKKSAYKTINLVRTYRDKKTNEWKTTNSFRITDLPKAILVMNKAYEYLALKDIESIEEESF